MAFTCRPLFRCQSGLVAAGHYLAAVAGHQQLQSGGNAIDAAAAASFALTVIEPHLGGLAGEVPILIYSAREGRVVAISGQGTAPQGLTLEKLGELGVKHIPGDGLLPATVPALLDAWILALQHYGTRSLSQVLAPALELARDGWQVQGSLARVLEAYQARFQKEWPTSAQVFLPNGEAPRAGQLLRNPDLAATFQRLIEAERAASGERETRLEAARDEFYRGETAARIDRHAREVRVPDASGKSHGGLLRLTDLENYRGRVEEPLSVPYRDTVVHKCSSWTQGPVFLQQLRLLEGFPLGQLSQADYLHTWIEVAKLAFADREAYYGDPLQAQVPLQRLLSAEYAQERRQLIDPARASELLRPGDGASISPAGPENAAGLGLGEPSAFLGDTTHVDSADRWGNLVAATPSGGWITSSPLIEGLGFPLGTRGQMFSLEAGHPNALAPGKRPRATLSPSLAFRGGRPWLAFGTPGGDMQDQWTLQFFLNVVDRGMGLQEAVEAPTVHTLHFPASFYPRAAQPLVVSAESRLPPGDLEALRQRGHKVEVCGPWEHGRVQAIARAPDGLLAGAVSPRRETAYAVGW